VHYRSLDGLRGLAAYTVVVSHVSNATGVFGGLLGGGAGQVGVLLFFVLSGFLMGRLYFDQALTVASVATFFRRRVARVVPLYLIVVLGSYFWSGWYGRPWPLFAVTDENVLAHLLFLEGTSILWTVPTEIQFYLLFPAVWLIARRLGMSVLLVFGLAIALTLASPLARPIVLPYLPYFLSGLFVAKLPHPGDRRHVDGVFVLALLAYVVTLPKVAAALGLHAGAMCSPSVYLIALPVLLTATLYSPLAERTLGHPVAAFGGAISYSVYLLHMPLLLILQGTPIAANAYVFLLVVLAAATLAGWLSFRFVEHPLRRLISGQRRPGPASANP
jgi:peptidoglycan/LPS O-acetylase OafA/YrhL